MLIPTVKESKAKLTPIRKTKNKPTLPEGLNWGNTIPTLNVAILEATRLDPKSTAAMPRTNKPEGNTIWQRHKVISPYGFRFQLKGN